MAGFVGLSVGKKKSCGENIQQNVKLGQKAAREEKGGEQERKENKSNVARVISRYRRVHVG